jgi:hypothetical protein
MRFQKPSIIVSGPALSTIQGAKENDTPLDSTMVLATTAGAYESDE